MKKLSFFIGLIFILSCTTPRDLLENGIKMNNPTLINQALSKGASFYRRDLIAAIKANDLELVKKMINNGIKSNDGLAIAIEQNNLDYVKFFVENGATPSLCLTLAVEKNNLDITKFLLDKGALFEDEEKEVIDGQVYLVNKIDKSDLIPIKIISVDGKNRWQMNNDKDRDYLESQAKKGVGYYVKYKIKKIKTSHKSLFLAIFHSNLSMIDLLISHGLDPKKAYVLVEAKDFRSDSGMFRTMIDNGGTINMTYGAYPNVIQLNAFVSIDNYICANQTPTPEIIMTPIQYAIKINANKNIIDALSR